MVNVKIVMIVVMVNNWVIGVDNVMFWYFLVDLVYFKCIILGKFVIMGCKIYEFIGRVLLG